MIMEHFELTFHPHMPHQVLDFVLGQKLNEPREGVADREHAEEDHENRVDPLHRPRHDAHLAEADARDGNDHHIKGVEERPSHQDVAANPDEYDDELGEHPLQDAPDRRASPEVELVVPLLSNGSIAARLSTRGGWSPL